MTSRPPATGYSGDTGAPLVSVLVPLYNHEQFVGQTLQSVAAQSYPHIELLVLDDGSTDGSYERAERFVNESGARFERVCLWRQPNAGVTRTLNRLFDAARGDIAMPIGSDDLLLPDGVLDRVRALDAAPGAVALFTDCIVIDDEGRQVYGSGIRDLYGGNPAALAAGRGLALSLMAHWCVPGGVLSLRREAFADPRAAGRADAALVVEDFDQYLRLAAASGLAFAPVATSAYRLHAGQTIWSLQRTMPAQAAHAVAGVRPAVRGLARVYAALLGVSLRAQELPRWHPRRALPALGRRAVQGIHEVGLGHRLRQRPAARWTALRDGLRPLPAPPAPPAPQAS